MKPIFTAAFAAGLGLAFGGGAQAEGDLSRANVIDVTIEMGTNDDGSMFFTPDTYTFTTGQAYKLVLTNLDDIKHELTLNEMGERIFNRKVEAVDTDGELIAEVKGSIREVEVGPRRVVEWYIVPVQPTEGAVEIACELPGHREAGMRADATIN